MIVKTHFERGCKTQNFLISGDTREDVVAEGEEFVRLRGYGYSPMVLTPVKTGDRWTARASCWTSCD
jgi:hypothetical protein